MNEHQPQRLGGIPGSTNSSPTGSLRSSSPQARVPPRRSHTMSETTADGGHAPGAVLVVDDLPLNRLVLGRMVRKAGLEVVEAANGAEALEQIYNNPPGRFNCVLMDLQMPVMDGWEATQQVRMWEANGGHEGAYSRACSSALCVDPSPDCGEHSFARSQTSPALDRRIAREGSSTLLCIPIPPCPSSPTSFWPLSQARRAADGVATQLRSDGDERAQRPQTRARYSSPRHMLRHQREACQRSYLLSAVPSADGDVADEQPEQDVRGEVVSLTDGAATGNSRQQYASHGCEPAEFDTLAKGATAREDVVMPKVPVRRIPIVACTAELLESPLGWALKANGAGAGVPTGSSSGGLPASPGATAASHAFCCGVDECVRKPLSYPALCDLLQRHIPEWSGPTTLPNPDATEAMRAALSGRAPVPASPAPPLTGLQAYVRSRTADESTSLSGCTWASPGHASRSWCYGRSLSSTTDVPEPSVRLHDLKLAEGEKGVGTTASSTVEDAEAVSFHVALLRSTCVTPCLETHESDIHEHLVELLPKVPLSSSDEALARQAYVKSASTVGSWCEPTSAGTSAHDAHMLEEPQGGAAPVSRLHTHVAPAVCVPAAPPSAAGAASTRTVLHPMMSGDDTDEDSYIVQSLCAWSADEYMHLEGILQASRQADTSTLE